MRRGNLVREEERAKKKGVSKVFGFYIFVCRMINGPHY
jgi:hypothetical protein